MVWQSLRLGILAKGLGFSVAWIFGYSTWISPGNYSKEVLEGSISKRTPECLLPTLRSLIGATYRL